MTASRPASFIRPHSNGISAARWAPVRALVVAALVAASCAPSTPTTPAPGGAGSTAVGNRAPAIAPLGRASDGAESARPAPPVVTTAMAGDPTGASLAEARLVATSCDDDENRTEEAIAKMRAEVDAQLEEWRKQQPGCWAERAREALEQKMWALDALQGATLGDSFGAGGLGLSGIGEGGGGRGEGIGLGSIGTIGHGSGPPRRASSMSKTNDQVAGVDEADIVKTDGRYVYLASNGALRIIEAMNPRVVSVTKIEGDTRELFVEGDRAVVYSSIGRHEPGCTYGYDCIFAGDGSSTKITVLDLADRAKPRVARTIELSGSLMASRRIGKTVHTVVADGDSGNRQAYETWPDEVDACNTDWHVVLAKFADLKRDNEARLRKAVAYPTIAEDGGAKTRMCSGLYHTLLDDGHAFTTVVSFALDDDTTPPATSTLESRPGAVFATADALYLAVRHDKKRASGRWYSFDSSAEVSEIHKFALGERPSETRYLGSGIVPGHVLNQFAMDEWSGYLRVATTRGRVPDPNVESTVSILRESPEHALVRVGAVEHIGKGEDVRAVRFDGDRGYVVTFKKTDPLFVVDLYDPTSPSILGELKIPGFSTYLHRIDANHLMSIGYDADDHGSFAYFNGIILQMFDVTNPTDPKLLFKEKIGSRGSSSAAATNHLAFNYFPERHLLALPMTVCEGGGDGAFGDDLAFSGLYVYDVTLEKGFQRLGGIDHGTRGVSCTTWWSKATSVVERSVFLDDLVYSIAGDRVKVQRMSRFGEDVADIALTP